MIYCIWYPSGGFGHFVNAVISLYGQGFKRPPGNFSLGSDGNSHNVPLVLPKYQKQQKISYELPLLDPNMDYTVLIDNGINDESQDFISNFPDSTVIKICYNDQSWPIIAYTHIVKAMRSNLDAEISVGLSDWPEKKDWGQREKIFLYLRDHDLRYRWKPDEYDKILEIDQLGNYDSMCKSLQKFNIKIENFKPTWDQWWRINQTYFTPVIVAKRVIDAIIQDDNLDLSSITDIWTQSIIYYFIWLYFNQEVPHNDFADFFKNTDQIRRWLQL